MSAATLLMIPGLLNTPRVFDRLRACWQGPAELRVADVRGPDHLAGMAEAAWSAVADLAPEQPLVVAGFSLGGYVALQMLAEPRRAVQGLGLICTSARADTPEGLQFRERAIAAMERDFERYVGTLAGFLLSAARADDAALKDELRREMRAVGAATAMAQHRAAAARPDRRALLPGLRLPALVLGALADPVTPPALSDEMARLLPTAQQVSVAQAGHMLPMEHPDRVAQALQGLVTRALTPVARP